MRAILFLISIAVSTSGWANQEFKKEAEQLASAVKLGLVTSLSVKIKELGAKGAVPFCHDKVGEIAKTSGGDLAKKYDFGRTSHLVRNKKNEPQDWMKPYLNQFKGTSQKDRPKIEIPIITILNSGEMVYLEPLYTMPMCLQCHGDQLATEVRKEIQQLYPQDQATKFKLGEFRGFIWVKQKSKPLQ